MLQHKIIDMEKGPWKGENWWVSQFNFEKEVLDTLELPSKVLIHDSTLRDGEQAAGVIFTKDQKVEIAKMLDNAGVQIIEAGFPAVSPADQEAIRAVCNADLNAKITCLCRAMEKDIDLAKKCGVSGAIIEVPVSYPRLKYQFEWREEDVIEKALRVVSYAKESGLEAHLFLIDSTRARMEFLESLVTRAVKEAGSDKVTVVDTNGCINPPGIKYLVKKIKSWVNVPIEMHCHNDFGLGVANSLAGVENGAESISCTLNALGQRAGNSSTEEVAFALECLYGVKTGIDFYKLYEVSQLVKRLSGWSFPPNKPITGDNLFTWEAGIPTAALMKNPHTVEPFQPEIFGRKHEIKLGKKSGKANIHWKLRELGLTLPEERIEKVLEDIKQKAITFERALTDEEFIKIIEENSK
ncbi:homocitrate synthase/isopropylmalate synthase family protein [Desulfitibacter alkalitolerans]|uniref:homocitrate synthase/isopropylmalate synthase family protein n=1 Tax=Desulfitibacter alkalitolerans TaxID=264641 RepID=UPI000683F569|nr:hypothetical protein [Desulfitibacter alkalitolerans]